MEKKINIILILLFFFFGVRQYILFDDFICSLFLLLICISLMNFSIKNKE